MFPLPANPRFRKQRATRSLVLRNCILGLVILLGGCTHSSENAMTKTARGCIVPDTDHSGQRPCVSPDVKADDEITRTYDDVLGTASVAPDVSIRKSSSPAVRSKDAQNSRRFHKGPLRLSDAVSSSVLTFPEVRIVEARVIEARAGISVAKAGLYPRLDMRVAAGPNFGGSYEGNSLPYVKATNQKDGRIDGSIVLQQLLFDFGATHKDIERAEFLRDSERHKLREKIDETAYKTAQVYTRILEQRAIFALSNETIASHEELLKIVQAQSSEGHGTVADVNRVKTRLVDVRAIRNDVSLILSGAEEQFERLTQIKPVNLVGIPNFRGHIPATSETAIAMALSGNPRLASLQSTKNSAASELEFQKASILPKINLEVDSDSKNYRSGASGRSQFETRAMVALRFRILDGGLSDATEKQIQARILGNEVGLLNEREQLEADIRQAYRAIDSAGRKLRLVSEGVASAASVRSLYLEQFKGGKRTIFELLDGQMSYYSARRSQIESQFEATRAIFDILRSTGELTRAIVRQDTLGTKGISGRRI
jgi:outer membrane protein, adhesin transport system